MKKQVILITIIGILLLILPLVAEAGTVESGSCGENLTFTLMDDGTLTVSGTGNMYDYSLVYSNGSYITSAPWGSNVSTVELCPGVTSVGENAFRSCSSLSGIIIPDSVTSIGRNAFIGCDSLPYILLPDNVTFFGSDAFGTYGNIYNAIRYAHLNSETAEALGRANYSFRDPELNYNLRYLFTDNTNTGMQISDVDKDILTFTIPNGVTSIGYAAFSGCSSLTSITIPNGVTNIGSNAFKDCTSLNSITIPNSVTSIGSSIFENCIRLYNVNLGNGITEIPSRAFYGCKNITHIKLPESITTISNYAFYNSIMSITLPENISIIGGSAFFSCNIENVFYYGTEEQWSNISIYDGNGSLSDTTIFYNARPIPIELDTEMTVNISVEGRYAFYSFTPEQSGNYILYSSGTNDTYAYKFNARYMMPRMNDACENDDGFADGNFQINTFLTAGETYVFAAGLKDKTKTGSFKVLLYKSNIEYTFTNGTLTISGSGPMPSYYHSSSAYGSRAKKVIIENGITSIGERAFEYYELMTEITIPSSITSIGEGVFCGCIGLTSITIPGSVSHIGRYAFEGCANLANIYLGDGITVIDEYAFSGCNGLTSITIPGSVKSIETFAFYYCNNLQEVVIENGLKSIGRAAFSMCTALENVEIPNSLISIGPGAFYNCGNLSSITIPDSINSIGESVFSGCNLLNTINTYCTGLTINAEDLVTYGLPDDGSVQITILHEDKLTAHAAIDATCTAAGNSAYWSCDHCGKYFSDAEGSTEIAADSWAIVAIGHTEIADAAVPATCTATGLTAGKHCSVCNEVLLAQEVIPAKGHTVVADPAVAATCTETGLTAGTHCLVCNEVFVAQEIIPAKGHTVVADPAVAATCTETGLTAGNHCSVCNEILTAQEVVLAKGHTEVADPAVAATCTETGLTTGLHCSVCNEVLVAQEVVPALGHDLEHHEAQVPTDTENGWAEYDTCKRDGCTYSTQHILTTEMFFRYSPAPTCITDGIAKYVCEQGDNGLHYHDIKINALGHDLEHHEAQVPTDTENGWAEYDTCKRDGCTYSTQHILTTDMFFRYSPAPTCITDGIAKYVCEQGDNGLHYHDIKINALGHQEVTDTAVAATCTETGLTAGSHCSVCNEVLVAQEIVSATGHTEVVDVAVVATCTETGLTEGKHCSACNEVLLAQEIVPAKGHSEVVDSAVAATCTEAGKTEGKHCDRCNTVLIAQETVAALGHDIEHHEAKAATCTGTGWETYDTCKREGCEYSTKVEIPALGHHEVTDAAVAATCTEIGLTEGKHCDRCREVLVVQQTVDALGHDIEHHEAKAATCTEVGWEAYDTCKREGCEYSTKAEIPALGHDIEHHEAKAATCTEDGWEVYDTCKREDCEYSTKVEIPALDHSWGEVRYEWAEDYSSCKAERVCARDATHTETETVTPEATVVTEATEEHEGKLLYTATFTNPAFPADTREAGIPKLEPTTPPEGSYNDPDGSGNYQISSDGTAEYSGAPANATAVVIPDSITVHNIAVPVVTIADKAFYKNTKVKSVTIGKNIKTIGINAFYGCKALTTVKGCANVVTIKDNAFNGCIKLKTLPKFSKLVTIGKAAFKGCKVLTTLKGIAKVKAIGKNAFNGCVKLKTIPAFAKLEMIGDAAFKGCKALTKLTLSVNVKKIGKEAFSGCAALKTITIKTTKLTSKNVGANAFKGINKKAKTTCPKSKLKTYKKFLPKRGIPVNGMK